MSRKVCHMLLRAHHQGPPSINTTPKPVGTCTVTRRANANNCVGLRWHICLGGERAALGHRHHFEPISRLRLLLCASGWPTVTNVFFSSALVFWKELGSALYFNSDLGFNDRQGTFQRISASLVFLWIWTDRWPQQRTMLTLVPKAHPMLKTNHYLEWKTHVKHNTNAWTEWLAWPWAERL